MNTVQLPLGTRTLPRISLPQLSLSTSPLFEVKRATSQIVKKTFLYNFYIVLKSKP